MIRIKICGITDASQVEAASAADFLGIVLAPSRRQVSPHKAADIVSTIHRLPKTPAVVGVFVNLPAETVNMISEECQMDWVQLSGDEDWEYCRNIRRPIIKALHISTESTSESITSELEKGYRLLPEDRLIGLLDSKIQGTYGGTGQVFNWKIAREVSARFPVFIAGGLTPANVRDLLQEFTPWGVDVSSGVETEGKKDPEKTREFIREVKKAEF